MDPYSAGEGTASDPVALTSTGYTKISGKPSSAASQFNAGEQQR